MFFFTVVAQNPARSLGGGGSAGGRAEGGAGGDLDEEVDIYHWWRLCVTGAVDRVG